MPVLIRTDGSAVDIRVCALLYHLYIYLLYSRQTINQVTSLVLATTLTPSCRYLTKMPTSMLLPKASRQRCTIRQSRAVLPESSYCLIRVLTSTPLPKTARQHCAIQQSRETIKSSSSCLTGSAKIDTGYAVSAELFPWGSSRNRVFATDNLEVTNRI